MKLQDELDSKREEKGMQKKGDLDEENATSPEREYLP